MRIPHLLASLAAFLASFSPLVGQNLTQPQQWMRQGDSCFFASKLDAAATFYQRTASIKPTDVSADSIVVMAHLRWTRILLMQSKPDSSKITLEKVSGLLERMDTPSPYLLSAYHDLMGDWYMHLGDAEQAIPEYKSSTNIRLKTYGEQHLFTAYSYSKLASYFNFKIENDSAFHYSKLAYSICQSISDNYIETPLYEIILTYGFAYKIAGLYQHKLRDPIFMESTRDIFREALHIAESCYGKNSYPVASIHKQIGNTYTDVVRILPTNSQEKTRQFQKGVQHYDISLYNFREIFGDNSPTVSGLYFVKGLMYAYAFQRDSIQKVRYNFDRAIGCVVTDYKYNNELTSEQISSCTYKYDLLTLLHHKSHSYYSDYHVHGDTASLAVSYRLSQLFVPVWQSIISEFKTMYANRLIGIYANDIFKILIRRAYLMYKEHSDEEFLHEIFKYSQYSKSSLQKKLSLQSTSSFQKKDAPILRVNEVQNELDDGSAFIEFFKDSLAIVITKNQFMIHKLNHAHNPNLLADSLFDAMHRNDASDYSKHANEVYKVYFEPLLGNIQTPVNELIIVPDGILHNIPVAALVREPAGGNQNNFQKLDYILKEYSMRFGVTASSAFSEPKFANSYGQVSLAAFVPEFTNLSSLPFSQALIEQMKNEFSGSYYMNDLATKQNFITQLKSSAVLHISSHGFSNMSNPAKSKLFMSGDSSGSVIQLQDIFQAGTNTPLIVLSACETGKGKPEYGEGAMTFSKAFLYAGATSSVSTIWQVDDKTTSDIMYSFYQNMDTHSIADALRTAQLNYLESTSNTLEANPFYWAGIVYTGPSQSISLKKKPPVLFIGFLLVSLAGLFTYMFIRKRKSG